MQSKFYGRRSDTTTIYRVTDIPDDASDLDILRATGDYVPYFGGYVHRYAEKSGEKYALVDIHTD